MNSRARLRRVALIALAVGAGLRWPALRAPLFADDYQQLAILRGAFPLRRASWDLFWFSARTPEEWQRLVGFGFNPWWTAPDHRLSMLRPLSSLLIAFDARVLGADPGLSHLHSLAWWMALCASAGLVFARALPERVAYLALGLFALDQAHTVPLAWLANRSTLVSGTFGMLALYAHLRARARAATAPQRWLALSALFWALALAGGEYALGMLAYALAFELVQRSDAVAARLRALAPLGAVALGYALLRAALGIGIRASGFYVSPSDPVRFAGQAAKHVPVLLSDLVLGVSADFYRTNVPWRDFVLGLGWFDFDTWQRLPDWPSTQIALGLGALALALAGVRALERRAGGPLEALRALALGALFAATLSGGALPSARLLIAPELGAAALLASALAACAQTFAARRREPRQKLASACAFGACLAIAGLHVILPAHDAYAETDAARGRGERARAFALGADLPADVAQRDVVLVSASDFTTAAHLPWVRWQHGLALPHSYRRLSGAFQAHDLTRIDAHTLELHVLTGDVHDAFAGSLYRAREQVFTLGQRIRVPGMTIEVLAIANGNPWRFRVRFDRALDDPRLLFVHAFPGGIRRLALPAQGETLRVPFAALP